MATANLAKPAAKISALLLLLSFCCLVWSFIRNDFTVSYIALQSNTLLPLGYKVAAVWGGHEGSLLLWQLMLSGWGLAVSWFARDLPAALIARVLAVLGLISAGFISFILFTSNPFARDLPWFAMQGQDLNPLLQDIGLIVHPPLLYMGYVGFAVAFAFAVAGLLDGRLDHAWARWTRPWATAAWCFLTVGIALGSWWAYYELGWGGWWFWDPVENASLMPWLVGTALIHSLAATEKRGTFKAWTVLLALLAFVLSLLGTFLVRSGVLTSVHAFASDPTRGLTILVFLCVVALSALILFGTRAHLLKGQAHYGWVSREMALLVNNVLLMVIATVVILGTLSPLLAEALGSKISIRTPYYNLFSVPLGLMLLLSLGFGAVLQWKSQQPGLLRQRLLWPALLAPVVGALFPWVGFGQWSWLVFITVSLLAWVLLTHGYDVWRTLKTGKQSMLDRWGKLSRSYKGMLLAHLGVVVTISGICLTSHFSVEKDVRMAVGESLEISGYQFTFSDLVREAGPNYDSTKAIIDVKKDGKHYSVMYPEKRDYFATTMPMTEVALDWGIWRDLYVALGTPVGDDAWAVRVYYKPFIRWIWFGALLMAAGGLLAITDQRYRRQALSRLMVKR